MLFRSEKNAFGAEIIQSDFQEIKNISNKYNAIVTDFPYGKSSKVSQKPENIIKKFFKIVPSHKKIAVMYKKELADDLKIRGLKTYQIYRHKSLTRTILIK